MADTHHIAFVVVDGFQPLDLFGPLEAFAAANALAGAAYDWRIAAVRPHPLVSESGVRLIPDVSIPSIGDIDTLVLCGGRGARKLVVSASQRQMLRRVASSARRTVSICTGAFVLAELGLVDGRRVTTHWRHARELRDRFPAVHVDADALFVRDETIWSSAGVTAGIDLALALIAEDHGSATAGTVARELVVYMRRAGDQAQFSEPLQAQSGGDSRLADLVEWAADHVAEPLTVEALAARAGMGTRHFSRVFRAAFDTSPARFIERLRLDKARVMLSSDAARIEEVARAAGFSSGDSFRRAFDRRFGLSPSQYQAQFAERTAPNHSRRKAAQCTE